MYSVVLVADELGSSYFQGKRQAGFLEGKLTSNETHRKCAYQ